MRLIRWFLTFVLLFAASLLAIALLTLLLVAFGVFKLAGAMRWVGLGPRPAAPPANALAGGRTLRDPGPDRELPEAPAEAALHHVRSWDAARNRAVDRWYYKDRSGQWVFVRAPRTA